MPHYTVHTPVRATADVIEKYRRLGYPAAGPDQQERRHNATYLAMIEELDRGTGHLLETLDRLDLTRRTVVVFLSDNGGVERVTDNGPLRWGKGSAYEGGIRVPMIVRWPGRVAPGTIQTEPVHVTDFYSTFAEIAGAAVPPGHPVDGRSLVPLLTGVEQRLERDLFWYMPLYDPPWGATPCAVLRRGPYKLIEYFGDRILLDEAGRYETGGRLELYHLRDDIGERHNLAEALPDLALAMQQALRKWITEMGQSVPDLNPDFDESDPLRRAVYPAP